LKAVVLAAGEGTRLRPFTMSRPKGMISVGNRPILEYVIEALVQNDVKDIVMVVGYRRDTILSHFEDGKRFGAHITYVAQDKQLGTAHALSLASTAVKDSDFLVVAGDNLIDPRSVADLKEKKDGPSIVVTQSEEPSKYGVAMVEEGRVVDLVEKPQQSIGNIINTGMYYFTPDMLKIFKQEATAGERGITQALKPLLGSIKVSAVQTTGKWIDAVYPWDLIAVNAAALEFHGQGIEGTVESGVTLKGPVDIGAGTRIRSGCYIEGPVSIGEGCDIGPNVTILPSTSIGDGVQIEPFTYIAHSLIMDNVRIGSHSHLSHSVLDDGVRSRAGLFASSGPAYARVDKELFPLVDVGALIGQDSTFGSRVVVTPGKIIGAGCKIADGVKIDCNLENRSVVV
jgi:UDP-N-acetylglucosamine diphosphorylase / glucose-1-phosphate thymidylyltransferase / UDP-N-acetylgalactosamine diphosphorylase / glucosamine-1-phosphate N-acetyltransferase / galactosamine-1-phosphate N-acetyltransferase